MPSRRTASAIACLAAAALLMPLAAQVSPASAGSIEPMVLAPKATLAGGTALATGVRTTIKATIVGAPAVGSRKVTLQARLGYTGAWVPVTSTTWAGKASSAAILNYTPTKPGVWQLRAFVAAKGTAKAITGATVTRTIAASRLTGVTPVYTPIPSSPWRGATGAWDGTGTFTVTVSAVPAAAGYSRSIRFEYRKVGTLPWLLGKVFSTPANSNSVTTTMPALPRGKYQGRLVVVGVPGLVSITSPCVKPTACQFEISPAPRTPDRITAPVSLSPETLGMGATAPTLEVRKGVLNGMPPATFGAIRLHDSGVDWRSIETRPGDLNPYNWAELDRLVALAERNGQAITYQFGSTPQAYAGTPVAGSPSDALRPGVNFPPTLNDPSMSHYRDFVRAVVKRYAGRIEAYQVWNECNLNGSWAGTAAQVAQMTKIVNEEVNAYDPAAKNGGCSFALRRVEGTPFIADYLAELDKLGWPLDFYSGHFYPLINPVNDGNPADADNLIGMFQRMIREAGGPAKPIWNTEMNYRTNPKFCTEAETLAKTCNKTRYFDYGYQIPAMSDSDLRAVVGQTFFRSLNAGVSRMYWYGWLPKPWYLGVEFVTGTPATRASEQLRAWLDNKGNPALTMSPCTIGATLAICPINYAGVTRYAVWSTVSDAVTASNFDAAAQEIVIPDKTVNYIARLDGTIERTGPFLVGAEPVLVDAS